MTLARKGPNAPGADRIQIFSIRFDSPDLRCVYTDVLGVAIQQESGRTL
jgi:hypothetical protein